jgi:hypothetical protein
LYAVAFFDAAITPRSSLRTSTVKPSSFSTAALAPRSCASSTASKLRLSTFLRAGLSSANCRDSFGISPGMQAASSPTSAGASHRFRIPR